MRGALKVGAISRLVLIGEFSIDSSMRAHPRYAARCDPCAKMVSPI